MRLQFVVRLALVAWTAMIVEADDGPVRIYGVYSEAAIGLSPYTAAPGSVILIFSGSIAIGPSLTQSAVGFPLVTNLAGASVRVTVSGASVDAFILGAETHWIRAMLPANTLLGDGNLVVTFNGQASPPYEIRVVERQFATYDGSWCGPSAASTKPSFCVPRSVQTLRSAGDSVPNSFLTPARPGQLVALWGTGLGFAPGDEASGPIPGNLDVPGLHVFVGNQRAKLLYAGRSGCCAGMDEILFEVPLGIEGCNVPVWVRLSDEGSASNDIFISIATVDGACSDPQGLSESEVRKLAAGELNAAQISATEGPPGNWGAYFGFAVSTPVIPFGTCRTYAWGAQLAVEVPLSSLKDAGAALNLQTPGARFVAPLREDNIYRGNLDSRLESGLYAIDNGAGGSGVAPFRATFSIPPRTFTWTNRDLLTSLAVGQAVTVSWSVADPSPGYVLIGGQLGVDGEYSGGFLCYERPDKGAFTVPSGVIERFRAGSPHASELDLAVGYIFRERVVIPGFEVAEFALSRPAERKTIYLR